MRALRTELAPGEALEVAFHIPQGSTIYDEAYFATWCTGLALTLANESGAQIWQGTTQNIRVLKAEGGRLDQYGIKRAWFGPNGVQIDLVQRHS